MEGNKKETRGLAQAEDLALKSAAAYFGEEIIPWLGIRKRMRRVAPTELVRLETRHLYEDFLYEMEDGTYYHFEFESDPLTREDLKRFREYEATTARTYQAPVVTYVVCSSGMRASRDSITEGINTYRVRLIRLKDRDADRILEQAAGKTGQEITREEVLRLLFTPLMGGKTTQKERIQKGIRVLKETEDIFSRTEISKMEAILYVFAAKFLDRAELESIKEEMAMTILGQMIWDDAMEKGIEKGIEKGRAAGRAEGERVGREAGEKLGREQASERYSRLILLLNERKQPDRIIRAAEDPAYREKLYKEYGI